MNNIQVSLEAQEGLQRRLRVKVPSDQVDVEISERLRKVAQTTRIKGFRPGKVPAKIIRDRYGAQVRQEVVQEILQSSFSQAISQESLRPAGGPRIEAESLEEGQDLAYTAIFEVYPEVQLRNLDQLAVTRPSVEIGAEDVDAMIRTLRLQRSTWQVVDEPADEGHQVIIDFEGRRKGEPLEGGKGDAVPIVIGEGQMLPDFEKNLKGLKAGDEKSFKLKFPKDYHAQELAGEKVDFSVKLKEVAARQLPDVDAEFIKAFGIDSGSEEDFRADVQGNMEREANERIREQLKAQVMEGLLETNDIQVPTVLIDQEASDLHKRAHEQAGPQVEQDDSSSPEAFREQAERRVKLGLLMGAVINDFEVTVDRDRLTAKIAEMSTPYENPDEIAKLYFQNPQLLSQVESVVLEEQVVDLLLDKATVTSKSVTFDEALHG